MKGPDEKAGAAVMKAVITMVEMAPSEFEVIVAKVEVALTDIWCQQFINSAVSKVIVTRALVGLKDR